MKTCTKCGEEKPLEDFVKYERAKAHHGDGHRGWCKKCHSAVMRGKWATGRYRDMDNERTRRRHQSISAHKAVEAAIKSGAIVRQPCEKCGDEDVVAHHPDYTKPLAVDWLCRVCHGEAHRAINQEIEDGQADKWRARGFLVGSHDEPEQEPVEGEQREQRPAPRLRR